MANQARFEVAVKGIPKDGARSSYEGTLGDCPFTHRVLLTLEEKHVPYVKHYVDTKNKPDWLSVAHPDKKVPAARDLTTGKWIADSASIVDYIEDVFPEPPLGHSHDAKGVGEGIFPAFVGYLKSFGKPEEKEQRAILEGKLKEIDAYLHVHSPFIHGKSVGSNDLELAPKLHHIQVVLQKFKDWNIYSEYSALGEYMRQVKARPSWRNTLYGDALVLKGWGEKIE